MANDAVRHQKVFVTLEGVLTVQDKLRQNQRQIDNTENTDALRSVYRERARAISQVITWLDLPITDLFQ